jgi:hypothetical protein
MTTNPLGSSERPLVPLLRIHFFKSAKHDRHTLDGVVDFERLNLHLSEKLVPSIWHSDGGNRGYSEYRERYRVCWDTLAPVCCESLPGRTMYDSTLSAHVHAISDCKHRSSDGGYPRASDLSVFTPAKGNWNEEMTGWGLIIRLGTK